MAIINQWINLINAWSRLVCGRVPSGISNRTSNQPIKMIDLPIVYRLWAIGKGGGNLEIAGKNNGRINLRRPWMVVVK
jgi:hypothetical protein